jgi:hypothetical protein
MFLVGEEVPERGDGALLAAAGGAILVSHQQPGGLVGGAIGRHVGGDEERFTGPASVVVVVVVVVAVAGLCTFKLFSELGTSYITGEPHRSQLAQALFFHSMKVSAALALGPLGCAMLRCADEE